eukprot:s4475_g2.t1
MVNIHCGIPAKTDLRLFCFLEDHPDKFEQYIQSVRVDDLMKDRQDKFQAMRAKLIQTLGGNQCFEYGN